MCVYVHIHLYRLHIHTLFFLSHFSCLLYTESYAPFQSMAVRESFLTVGGQMAAAPGPAHYTPTQEMHVKGGDSLQSQVLLFMYVCVHEYSNLHV